MTENVWTEANRVKRRCPHCGAPGICVHCLRENMTGQIVECDACGTSWKVEKWTNSGDKARKAGVLYEAREPK